MSKIKLQRDISNEDFKRVVGVKKNNSGITGSGTANISIPAGVPQTHILKIEVKDSGVVTGVAIEGTLSFRGYLGKCTQ